MSPTKIPSPETAKLEYDPAQHRVPRTETTEVLEAPEPMTVEEAEQLVESSRKMKAAPAPRLPLDVARALGVTPEGAAHSTDAGTATSPADALGGSMFWDDEAYYAATVQAGDVEIRLRELSEETLQFVASFNTRVEEATEKRVGAELAGHLFSGFKNAPPKVLEQARAVSTEDAVLIKELISAMRDKVLCEGIAAWEPAPRPCTDENKLKLGRAVRDKCLQEIFRVSTFTEKEQDFLEGSPSPSSAEKSWTSSLVRNTH